MAWQVTAKYASELKSIAGKACSHWLRVSNKNDPPNHTNKTSLRYFLDCLTWQGQVNGIVKSQVLPYDLARVHPRSQTVQRLVQPHLGAAHKDEFPHYAFSAEQIF